MGVRKYTLRYNNGKDSETIRGMKEAHDRAEVLCRRSKKHQEVTISDAFGLTCTVIGRKGTRVQTIWTD